MRARRDVYKLNSYLVSPVPLVGLGYLLGESLVSHSLIKLGQHHGR